MTRVFAVILGLAILGACGGSSVTRGSGGPIASACLGSGRSAVSRELCSCIQTAANQSLSSGDQRRGASFFGNPERAHAVRLSDTTANDAFWARWTRFGEVAERMCG